MGIRVPWDPRRGPGHDHQRPGRADQPRAEGLARGVPALLHPVDGLAASPQPDPRCGAPGGVKEDVLAAAKLSGILESSQKNLKIFECWFVLNNEK